MVHFQTFENFLKVKGEGWAPLSPLSVKIKINELSGAERQRVNLFQNLTDIELG